MMGLLGRIQTNPNQTKILITGNQWRPIGIILDQYESMRIIQDKSETIRLNQDKSGPFQANLCQSILDNSLFKY